MATVAVRQRLVAAWKSARVRRAQRLAVAAIRAPGGVVPAADLSELQSARHRHHRGVAVVVWHDGAKAAVGRADSAGDITASLGMSEPGAGSDLASLKTRAVLDGDHFLVNGQKVWTSGAHHADVLLTFVRTDPEAPKHKGISVLLIPTDTPGVVCRPFSSVSDLEDVDFNEVFFTDARIPAENLVGELNGGWRVATGSLGHERAMLWMDYCRDVARADHRCRPIRGAWSGIVRHVGDGLLRAAADGVGGVGRGRSRGRGCTRPIGAQASRFRGDATRLREHAERPGTRRTGAPRGSPPRLPH